MVSRGILVRLAATSLAAAFLLLGFSVPVGPLPPLGGLLEPQGGFWSVGEDAVPISHQTLDLEGMESPVEVYRDQYGVPHLFAASDADLHMAIGYVHAQDRLFQMDLQRRLATGRLSEVLGSATVETDRFFRSIGMNWAVERNLKAYDEDSLEVVDAYAAGVNAYLRVVDPQRLPLEFKLLNYRPEPWTPRDSVAFAKFMGWSLSGSFEDVALQRVVDAYGVAAADELYPVDMPLQIPIVPPGGPPLPPPVPVAPSPETSLLSDEGLRSLLRFATPGDAFSSAFESVGSNNWAVSGARTASGSALLANDPHLSLDLPSLWYQAHLVSPEVDVYGVTLLGAPPVVLGFNEDIAWGFTNTGADVVDFYVERINAADPGLYRHRGEWKDLLIREETIRVRNGDPIPLQINITVHGPLLDVDGQQLAINWTGHTPTFELRALLDLNRASDWTAFRRALRDWHVPAQNVVYADRTGNIGIVVNGLYPVRGSGALGRTPMNGSSGDFDWTGFVPMDEVPASFNPPKGFLVSANQAPTGPTYPHYLGWSWADRYRAQRIHDVLEDADSSDAGDMRALQLDRTSAAAQVFVPYLLAAYEALGTQGPSLHPQAEDAIDLLRDWNFRMNASRVEPTIYWLWLRQYRETVFRDEWGQKDLADVGMPAFTILELLTTERPSSRWFDNVTTGARETRDDAILTAFAEALEMLETFPRPWRWGTFHRLEISHLLGLEALSAPSVPRDGGPFTVDVAAGAFRDGHTRVTSGPSWRLVVELGTPVEAWGVHPGGQSGNPLNPHYTDLLDLWLAGEYQTLHLLTEEELQTAEEANGDDGGRLY